jgi:hypothetical protein
MTRKEIFIIADTSLRDDALIADLHDLIHE